MKLHKKSSAVGNFFVKGLRIVKTNALFHLISDKRIIGKIYLYERTLKNGYIE